MYIIIMSKEYIEKDDLELSEQIGGEDENTNINSDGEESYKSDLEGEEETEEFGNEDMVAIESDDEMVMNENEEIVPKDKRISRPFMTKYELTRIIGTRRKQLSLGAKPLVKIDGKLSINEIVNEEIKAKMIPLKIKRPLPDSNQVEIWDFKELDFSHLI